MMMIHHDGIVYVDIEDIIHVENEIEEGDIIRMDVDAIIWKNEDHLIGDDRVPRRFESESIVIHLKITTRFRPMLLRGEFENISILAILSMHDFFFSQMNAQAELDVITTWDDSNSK